MISNNTIPIITIILLMCSGVGLFSTVHFLVIGIMRRFNRLYLLFSALCIIVTAYLIGQIYFYKADDYAVHIAWGKGQIMLACLFYIIYLWFIGEYCSKRSLYLFLPLNAYLLIFGIINCIYPEGIAYSVVNRFYPQELPWGEMIHTIDGTISIWMVICFSVFFMELVYTVYASYMLLRKGHINQALAILIIAGIFIVSCIFDFLFFINAINFVYTSQYAFIIMIFIMSTFLSATMSRLFTSQEVILERLRRENKERIKAEKEVDGYKKHLENQVKRRTAELKNAKEYAERLFQITPSALFTVDNNTVITDWNEKAEEITGYHREEVIGQKCSIFIGDSCTGICGTDDKNDELTECSMKCNIVTKDGINKIISKNIDTLYDDNGNVAGMIESFDDITERIMIEKEIKKFFIGVEQSGNIVVITDPNGTIEYVNTAFERITGYTKMEVAGQNPRVLKSGVHEDAFYKDLWDTIIAGEIWEGEFANKRKDGTVYWERAVITPIKDKNGQIINFMAIKEDITAQKENEKKLKAAVSELETIFDNSAVAIALLNKERTFVRINKHFTEVFGYTPDDIIGQNAALFHLSNRHYEEFGKHYAGELVNGDVVQQEYQLRKKNGNSIWCDIYGKAIDPPEIDQGVIWVFDDITERKKLDEFRSSIQQIMRHDLKAPLNGIIGFPRLMKLDDNLTEEQIHQLDLIEKSAQKMLRQIEVSLILYKIERGAYKLKTAKVHILKVLREVINGLDKIIKVYKVPVELQIGDVFQQQFVFVSGEAILCYTLLTNLIKNAIEASPEGCTVTIRLEYSDQVMIIIHNMGEIPPEVQPVFFDKFVTADKTGGTGLGTFSAKIMTDAMRGTISFITGPESGTTLSVRLPGGIEGTVT